MKRPVIGITVDNKDNSASSLRYESSIAYSRAIADSGGTPVLLPHQIELVDTYIELCDGVMLTGGVDPRTEAFGEPTHPKAKPMDPMRQAFELALLTALDERPQKPVLGICLGMQLMALHAGGRLNQHLPDTLGEASVVHAKDNRHPIKVALDDSVLGRLSDEDGQADRACDVVSWHSQAVDDPGRLRLVGHASDGVVEAIDDPSRPFYLGVQWHPERADDACARSLNQNLLAAFVCACPAATG